MRRAPARDSRRVYKIHYSQTHTCTCYFGKMRRRRTLDVVRRRPTPSCRKRSRPTNVERILATGQSSGSEASVQRKNRALVPKYRRFNSPAKRSRSSDFLLDIVACRQYRAGERWGLNSVEVLNSNNRTTVGSVNNSRICEAGT